MFMAKTVVSILYRSRQWIPPVTQLPISQLTRQSRALMAPTIWLFKIGSFSMQITQVMREDHVIHI